MELKRNPVSLNQSSSDESHSKLTLLERAKAASEKLPDIGDVESGLDIHEGESMESIWRCTITCEIELRENGFNSQKKR